MRFTGNFEVKGWALVNITDGKTVVSCSSTPPSPQLQPSDLVSHIDLSPQSTPEDESCLQSFREIVPGELVENFCSYMQDRNYTVYRWDGGSWRNDGTVGDAKR